MATPQTLPFFMPQPAPPGLKAPERRSASPYPQWVSAVRKFFHGAGASLLLFSGANSITSDQPAAALVSADAPALLGALGPLLGNDFAGPVQIVVAVLLFLAAGQSIARFVGLAVAAIVIFCYLNGVGPQDMWVMAQHFFARLGVAIEAFNNAQIS